MPVLRALQGLSGTLQQGFEQRGTMALDTAKMGLARERLGYEMRQDDFERRRQEQQDLRQSQQDIRQTEQDRLDLPIQRANIGKAQEEMRKQQERKLPANMGTINKMFRMEASSPLQSVFFARKVVPAFFETSEWKIGEDKNFYDKNNQPITQGDIDDHAQEIFGVYSTLTDPKEQLKDLAATLDVNPSDSFAVEAMKNPEIQNALKALKDPNSDQTSLTNFLTQHYEHKINTGRQVAAAIEKAGGNTAIIDKAIARYEKKLSEFDSPTLTTKEKADLRLKVFNSLQEEWKDRALMGEKITPEQQRAEVKSLMDIAMDKSTPAKPTLRSGTVKGMKVFFDGKNYFKDAEGKIPLKTKATGGKDNLRADGTKKGQGFLGELKRSDGRISTEISIGVEIDGKETEIPSLVPGLEKKEIDYLLNTNLSPEMWQTPTGKSIMTKAIAHAKKRIAEGKSVFAEETKPTKGATRGW